MAGQSVTFDFLSRGADSLAGDFRKTGDNAALAAKGARLLADSLERERKAAAASVGATLALAKADSILEEAEHGLADGALEAEFALKRQAAAAKKAGVDAAAARAGFSGLAGSGGIPGGGMAAVAAAGVALSPVIATLGVGLGGLGLAALQTSKNTKLMGQVLSPLKTEFRSFSASLQPEVLGIFGQGVKIAGHALHDIQPVAAATGKALDTVLGRVDRELQGGTWKQFFTFMGTTAAPDMKLLGDNFIHLLDVLPALLTDLQPLAQGFLEASDNALKLAGSIANFGKSTDKTSNSVGTNVGLLGFLAKAVANVTSFMHPGGVAAGALAAGLAGIPAGAGKAGTGLAGTAGHAQTLAASLAAARIETTKLTSAENAALSPLLAYSNALIAQQGDAARLNTALQASHDRIGLATAAQRASFGAANTYIQDLLNTASAAGKSHQGLDAVIGSLRAELPHLQSAKGGTQAYWQQVQTLVGWLHKLQAIKAITEAIHVNASGVWSVTPGKIGLPGGTAGGPFAYGGRVTGGTPGRDSVLGMLMPGEVVVPVPMVRAGAVDHLRGQLPGFATGGVVGSYGPGAVAGLPRWIAGETNATVSAVARSTATALLAGIKAASAASQAAGAGIRSTALGGDEGANRALARSMFPWPASMWPAYVNLEMAEAGFNRFARNPSSGAYGIPQALPPSKLPFAGQAAGGSHAGPQIAWMYNYIAGRYGNPVNAWAHEVANHWYASGGLVSRQGAAYLKAWQTKHGGGFGAAWGPVVLNQQIPEMAAAVQRARALAGASGLSPGQHRFWASAATDETRRLAVLHKELTTERAWRTQLGLNELGLDKQIRAAGSLPSLAGAVRGWKAQMGRDRATVAGISRMLGYSDAYLASHKPPPAGVLATHSYGGDVANNLGTVLAAALGPFTGAARGGMVSYDQGGWLRPGATMAWNGTGRPEMVVPARGGGAITLEVTSGGSSEFEQFMTTAIRKWVKVKGGGNVERAFGSR
jgi:hypothetical protein